jgi:Leucine-rich repeat (LRR) protein
LTTLQDLKCYDTDIINLTLPVTNTLTSVSCYNNSITSLDFSQCTGIEILDCSFNSITNLDVSSLNNMTVLGCTNNDLSELNVANSNNTNMNFYSTNNPNLNCINVDDAVYSTSNWSNVDSHAVFSESCATTVGIGATTQNKIKLYPNPAVDFLTIESNVTVKQVYVFDIDGQMFISDANLPILNVSDFSKGIYFLKILTEEGATHSVKFSVK